MKLIVTDLDNTLLRSNKTISEYTVDVFNRCREKGHKIVFATARAENSMTRFVDRIKPDAIISSGGAMVSLNGETIYDNILSSEDVSVIVKEIMSLTYSKAKISAESINGYFCNFIPDDPDRFNAFTYKDFHDFDYPCYKITAELEQDSWGEIIANKCINCSVLKYSGEKWQRFASKHSTKDVALKILLDKIGLNTTDVIAFGDDFNDFSMLKLSEISVAPNNAIDEIKLITNFITDSNDNDGVAIFLETQLLSE